MCRKLPLLVSLVILCMPVLAQESWTEYFSNEQLSIEYKYSQCHYPEKGVHTEYVVFKVTNKTGSVLNLGYKLDMWFNNSQAAPDKSNYEITVPASGSVESSCGELKEGLHVYSKILDLKPQSVLSKFEFNNLTANGAEVAR